MQYPLEAQGEFWKQMVPDWSATLSTINPTVPALSLLAKQLKGTVLISHSQSGIYPFQTAALSREGVVGIVSIEPAACPAADSDMTPYRNLPILVLWGDYVDLVPRWAPRLKARQRGGRQGRARDAGRRRDAGPFAHADAGPRQPADRGLAVDLDRDPHRSLIGSLNSVHSTSSVPNAS
jgi:hypothetical protein